MTATKNARASTGQKLFPAIHACRKQVAGLAEEEVWRDYLRQLTGRDSLRKMTGAQLGRVLDDLHSKGARKAPPKRAFKARTRKLADGDQARLIRALWLDLWNLGCIEDSSEEALASFVRRQAKVDALEWLPADKAASVIEALKGWLARPVEKGGGGVDWSASDHLTAICVAQLRRLVSLRAASKAHPRLKRINQSHNGTIADLGKLLRAELAKRKAANG